MNATPAPPIAPAAPPRSPAVEPTDAGAAEPTDAAAQTRELAACQHRIGELEQHLEAIAALLHGGRGAGGTDPQALLEELAERLQQFEQLQVRHQETIDQLSRSLAVQQVDDALDDACSRRNVVRRVDQAVRRAQRYSQPLICLMIGLDDASGLRATHGSLTYDYLLVQAAQRLQRTLRRSDVLMRYNDEAFLLMTDAKSIVEGRAIVERLIRVVCGEPIEMGSQRLRLGISAGILHYRPEMGGANELLQHAWKTLGKARRRGPRQIAVAPLAADE